MWSPLLLRLVEIWILAKLLKSEEFHLICDSITNIPPQAALFGYPEFSQSCTITGQRIERNPKVTIRHPGYWGSPQLDELQFTESHLSYIPPSFFSEYRNLRHLNISNAGIIEISYNTFTSADQLRWLTLSGNEIDEIKDYVFSSAPNLCQIDLSHNRITNLSNNSFSGLGSLKVLNLVANQIENINEIQFSDIPLLEQLFLAYNQLANVNANIFNNLTDLRIVDLSGNRLTTIDSSIFKTTQNIEEIYLSNNHLRNLYLNVGESLARLDASHNELDDFHLNCPISDLTQLQQAMSSLCPVLEFLDLSYNQLRGLNGITKFENLKELIFSHNYVGKLNVSTLRSFKTLEKLDLGHTNLSGLAFGTFSQQTHIKYLDISENSLGQLNLDIFLPSLNQHIEEFYLNGNNLSEIRGEHTFKSFPSLSKLRLGNNQFNCSYLLKLVSAVASFALVPDERSSSDDHENVHGIECNNTERSVDVKGALSGNATKDEKSINVALIESLVIIIAVLVILAFIYKAVHIFAKNRNSLANIVRFKAQIPSDADLM